MRIALLTPLYETVSSSKSGIAKHYRHLADALAALGHEVSVVFVPEFFCAQPLSSVVVNGTRVALHQRRVTLPRLLDRVLAPRVYARRLLHTVLSGRAARREMLRLAPAPDVIEATSFGALGLRLGSTALRDRLITRVSTTSEQLTDSFQHFQSRAQGAVNRLERRAILRSPTLLTHTREHARALERTLGLPADTFHIVPHGIPDAAPITPALPRPPGPTLLFAGQFTERKGIDVVLAAIPRVLNARPTARFVLAGGPVDSELVASPLKLLRQTFGARLLIVPDPNDAQLQAWIESCDVFTAPSRYESFGLVYLEAMRAAKPVVATRAGGIPEVVSDGETGMLVPPGDAAALAGALLRCLDDAGMSRDLGAAGRRRFLAEFTAETMARRSVDLYAHTIAARPR